MNNNQITFFESIISDIEKTHNKDEKYINFTTITYGLYYIEQSEKKYGWDRSGLGGLG